MTNNRNKNAGKPVLVTHRTNHTATVDSYRQAIGYEAQRRRERNICNAIQKALRCRPGPIENVLFYFTFGMFLTGLVVFTVNEIQYKASSSSTSPDAPDSDELLPCEQDVISPIKHTRSGSITNNTTPSIRMFHSRRPHTPLHDSTLLHKGKALLVRASDGSEHVLFADDSSGHSGHLDDSSIPGIHLDPKYLNSYGHFYIHYIGMNLGIKASSFDKFEMWWHATQLPYKVIHSSPHLQRNALIDHYGYEGFVRHVVASIVSFGYPGSIGRVWNPEWSAMDKQQQNSNMVLKCAEISLYWMKHVQQSRIFILTAEDIVKMREIYESLLYARLPKSSKHFHVNSEMNASLMRVFIDACDSTLSTINKEPTRFEHGKANKAILDEFVRQLTSSIHEFRKMALDDESLAKEEENHSTSVKP
ncbi:hypothetical protein [Legionella worsleiensis]|uniref:Uncharacterized protein n=1 Tax=Legionella worsleiensis TaxID=45076 RepID=A0A0W1AAC2_9GAMM|nr:hypothetical protein [Legionella worsleiensis]KTD78294.1 hypothetical protein Lwor_1689 [Legionella worsleiensis]STY32631.1 Uncharacterised protein [Legionella worsleiensis]